MTLQNRVESCSFKGVDNTGAFTTPHGQIALGKIPLPDSGECESRAGLYLKASEVGGERNLAVGRSHVLEHVSLRCLPLCKNFWRFRSGLTCCCCSFPKLSLTFDPMDYSTQASLSFSISWSLLRFMSTESVMPSNHLILFCPLLLLPSIFPSFRVFSND